MLLRVVESLHGGDDIVRVLRQFDTRHEQDGISDVLFPYLSRTVAFDKVDVERDRVRRKLIAEAGRLRAPNVLARYVETARPNRPAPPYDWVAETAPGAVRSAKGMWGLDISLETELTAFEVSTEALTPSVSLLCFCSVDQNPGEWTCNTGTIFPSFDIDDRTDLANAIHYHFADDLTLQQCETRPADGLSFVPGREADTGIARVMASFDAVRRWERHQAGEIYVAHAALVDVSGRNARTIEMSSSPGHYGTDIALARRDVLADRLKERFAVEYQSGYRP